MGTEQSEAGRRTAKDGEENEHPNERGVRCEWAKQSWDVRAALRISGCLGQALGFRESLYAQVFPGRSQFPVSPKGLPVIVFNTSHHPIPAPQNLPITPCLFFFPKHLPLSNILYNLLVVFIVQFLSAPIGRKARESKDFICFSYRCIMSIQKTGPSKIPHEYLLNK